MSLPKQNDSKLSTEKMLFNFPPPPLAPMGFPPQASRNQETGHPQQFTNRPHFCPPPFLGSAASPAEDKLSLLPNTLPLLDRSRPPFLQPPPYPYHIVPPPSGITFPGVVSPLSTGPTSSLPPFTAPPPMIPQQTPFRQLPASFCSSRVGSYPQICQNSEAQQPFSGPPNAPGSLNWHDYETYTPQSISDPNITEYDKNRENAKNTDPDKEWVKNWTQKITFEKKTKIRRTKISDFKEKFKKFANDVKELESLSNCLSVLKKSLNDKEWQERCEEVEAKKARLNLLMNDIKAEGDILESLIKSRKKKRIREKRKKAEARERMREAKIHREREHKRIDMWLEKMKEEVERAKREEQVKAEADIVLSEVTQKKSVAKYTLNLLSTLTKLRNARVQSLRAKGGNVSENEIETFNEVIERLKKYWMQQLKEYNLEEQGLKVMLEHAEVKRSNVQLTIKKEILEQWSDVIFGTRIDKVSKFEPHNLEELISVRFAWDKYVCLDNSVMATNIPIGWVIPSGPSNEDWAQLLESS